MQVTIHEFLVQPPSMWRNLLKKIRSHPRQKRRSCTGSRCGVLCGILSRTIRGNEMQLWKERWEKKRWYIKDIGETSFFKKKQRTPYFPSMWRDNPPCLMQAFSTCMCRIYAVSEAASDVSLPIFPPQRLFNGAPPPTLLVIIHLPWSLHVRAPVGVTRERTWRDLCRFPAGILLANKIAQSCTSLICLIQC